MIFEELGLKESLLKAVKEAGFTEPSPIQAQAIPAILKGEDLIGQAQTGTGKTAAFGLGIMNQIDTIPEDGVQALILTPTRELCTQVSDELYRLGRFAGIRTVAVYGGMSIKRQVDLVERGAQIVVATPGRLLDHLLNERFKDFNPKFVAIDEADEMLDMGFLDDVEEIFKHLPKERQTLLFSATMPAQIQRLAGKILKDPVTTIRIEAKEATAENIEQYFHVIEDWERMDAIARVIDAEDISRAIIFCRTKRDADELATALMAKGYPAKALHGDLDQRQREEVIKGFKAGKLSILVATDVAARGLDIRDVSHVFNYHIPLDPESYVHRIGRTGRAGKSGKAITLVTPLEFRELNRIKVTTKAQIYHLDIPSIEDVQNKQALQLVEKIRKQAISDEATELYKLLLEEMDSASLSLKLISKILGKNVPTGPKTIGIRGDKLTRLIEAKHRTDDKRGGGGRPFNKKPGGGGGYRGGAKFDDSRGGARSGGYGDRSGGGDRSSSYGDRSPSSGGERSSSYGDRNSGGGNRGSSYGDRSGGGERSSSYGDRNSGGGNRGSSYGDRSGNRGSSYGDRSGGGDRPSRDSKKDGDDK